MLSFAFYLLIKNSAAYRTAQQEVDDVCGKGPIKVEHISKLKYLNAVLRETLRLHPTAPAFSMCPKPGVEEHPTLCGGKYAIGKNEPIICLLPKVHTDPAVYGEDAEEFKPERMLDEAFEKLPKYAWKVINISLIIASVNDIDNYIIALWKWNARLHRQSLRLAGSSPCSCNSATEL